MTDVGHASLASNMRDQLRKISQIESARIMGPCACPSVIHRPLNRSRNVGTYMTSIPNAIGNHSGMAAFWRNIVAVKLGMIEEAIGRLSGEREIATFVCDAFPKVQSARAH